jgi:hypothetical protein
MARKNAQPPTPSAQEAEPADAVVIIDPDKVQLTVSKEYSVTDERIAELKQLYGDLQIADASDKVAIQTATLAVRELRTIRTTVEKKRLELKRLFTGAIDGIAKRIQSELNPIEERLKNRLDEIEREEEIRKAAELKARITKLCDAGYHYNGVAYLCGTSTIFEVSVPELTDEQIEDACIYAQEFRTAELEAERLRKAIAARLKAENEAKEREIEELKAKLAALEAAKTPEPAPEPAIEPDAVEQAIQSTGNVLEEMADAMAPLPAHFPTPEVVQGMMEATAERREATTASMRIRETTTAASSAAQTFKQYTSEFDSGYECFRKQAIKMFAEDGPKLTRAQWREKFAELQPHTRV